MTTNRFIRRGIAVLAVCAALAGANAQPAQANPVVSVTYTNMYSQPINTWINLTYNRAGNPPAWNCWQQVKFGNSAGSAYVQIRYIAGHCSDNTGLAVTEQRHSNGSILRTPNLGVCTTWNGGGCYQIPGGIWMIQVGGSSSVISGDFRLCQNAPNGTDTCRQTMVTWAPAP